MAEYRIVARLDPQTAAGSAKVKQDLKSVQAEANATGAALSRSFDQAKFDATIGSLVSRLEALDRTLASSAGQSKALTTANEALGPTLDRVAGSASKAATANAQNAEASALAATQAGRLAVAQEAVAVANGTASNSAGGLARAQQLMAGGQINITSLLSRGATAAEGSAVATGALAEASAGAAPAVAGLGAEVAGSVGGLGLMGTAVGVVGGLVGGLFATAIAAGIAALVEFAIKQLKANDAIDDAVDKIRKDAEETEITRQAHERWSHTLDGLIDRQRDLADAIKKRLQIQSVVTGQELNQASAEQDRLRSELDKAKARDADLQKQLRTALSATGGVVAGGGSAPGTASFIAGQQADERIARIRKAITDNQAAIARLQTAADLATSRVVGSQILAGEQEGKALTDLTARAELFSGRYQDALRGILMRNDLLRAQTPVISAGFDAVKTAIDKAASAGVNFDATFNKSRDLALAMEAGRISAGTYRKEMDKLAAALTATAKAAQDAKHKVSDGVPVFRSAQQAIGIAGRELLGEGLRVSENPQFGGVTAGIHKGAGHADGRAVDINQGSNINESQVPDIRAKFDAMARRYAARGYIVLWNGNRYDPSGKISPITGSDKHFDHMHLEAPVTIVGKPTQSGVEGAYAREARSEESAAQKAARQADQENDFVQGIVIDAAKRGQPKDAQTQLNTQIDTALAEFTKRFNHAASDGQKATITKALTDADTREIAERFDQAYVQPLQRLQALQGKVGLDRQVLNAQLEESVRRYGPATEGVNKLSDAENKQIEIGIRRGDLLQREAEILQSVQQPLDDYKQTIAALNDLLAQGAISQESYNSRVADLAKVAANTALAGLKGTDPGTGKDYQDLSAIADENARYAKQLDDFRTYREQLLQMGIDFNALEQAAAIEHADKLLEIDRARREVNYNHLSDIAGSVTSIMRDAFGEQSRIARAAFAAEKAVAIARSLIAIQEGVAQAAKLPFPANLPAIATVLAATASIVSNIRSVTVGYKEGGWTGDAGTSTESGTVHGQEFVVKAPFARQNRSLLEAVNSGKQVRAINAGQARDAANSNAPAAQPVVVPAPNVNVRAINVVDPRMIEDYFATPEGEQTFVNLVGRNSETIRRASGGGVD